VSRASLRQQVAAAVARRALRASAAPAAGVTASAEQKEIKKVLIANRGEIAVRVIRACKELGLQTVAVYSTADKDCLHVQLADEAVCIGEAPSSESYLSIPSIISAAISRNADAIHPGYGFLSENSTFVDICADHGLEFIGPRSDSIRIMGDKSTARDTMKNAGVPTVPGSDGLIKDAEDAVTVAGKIGFPIMIKATAGGGGRGMRLAQTPDEFLPLLKQAQQEAEAAFGNGAVYLERYVQNPRHIEFQVLADKHGNVVHLGERDCSIQRRNQKLLEEAPSPVLTPEVRRPAPGALQDGMLAAAAGDAGLPPTRCSRSLPPLPLPLEALAKSRGHLVHLVPTPPKKRNTRQPWPAAGAQGDGRRRRERRQVDRLHRGGHHRVPVGAQGLLLHGDEHPHPGGAPGDRDDHGGGPDPGADQGGHGPQAALQPGGHQVQGPRD
jgi:acetyl-CoA carboxylase biotin carboxylase subunit